MTKLTTTTYYYFAWIVSLLAMGGSLFFSEVMGLTPCTLCWYQRILMYPLTLLIGIGIFRKNKDLPAFVLPFSILGTAVALFHYLLQWGIVKETGTCSAAIPCTDRFIDWFGFVTIPLLSLVAFSLITAFIFLANQKRKQ